MSKQVSKVEIDGIEYVPASSKLSKEAMQALGEAYSIAFAYGSYDPDQNPKYLRKVWDLLHLVNKELHFKD